jgi:hypothetical protein
MRIGALLALDRDRQPLRRGIEIVDPQDGVARLGQALDGSEPRAALSGHGRNGAQRRSCMRPPS